MAGAAAAATKAADIASRVAARPIQAATGGQGGTVLLIMGVLFLGYLFISRRLGNVMRALALPADQFSAAGTAGGTREEAGAAGRLKKARGSLRVKPDSRSPSASPGADLRGTVIPGGKEWRPSWATDDFLEKSRNTPADAGYGRFFGAN